MKNYGIIPEYCIPSKKDLLFFDHFISMGGGWTKTSHLQHPTKYGMHYSSNYNSLTQQEADYSYLRDAGILDEDESSVEQYLQEAKDASLTVDDIYKKLEVLRERVDAKPYFTGGYLPPVDSGVNQHIRTIAEENLREYKSHIKARIFSLTRSNPSSLYTPIIGIESIPLLVGDKASTVIQIAIKKFPVPSDETSYEEILDFKSEKKVESNIYLFKRWIRQKVSEENLNGVELEEEIVDTIHDFREYMKLAKIKYNEEVIYTLLTFPLATIERICKLQFSKLFDPVFNIRKARIALLEAEIKAPGREIAFLHGSIERFEKSANE